MAKRLTPTAEEYAQIDRHVGLRPGEFYTIVTHKVRGRLRRSIHVFTRQPTQAELTAFEDTASKVHVRGKKTEFSGSQIKAFATLYDLLVDRAYDVVDGFAIRGEINLGADGRPIPDPTTGRVGLNREEARQYVNAVTKREALRDITQEVFSEGRLADVEGEEEEFADKKEDDRRTPPDPAPTGD